MLTTTEESLREYFQNAAGKDGCVERVKKIRDYAFIHFRDRDDAVRAMQSTDGMYTSKITNIQLLQCRDLCCFPVFLQF